MLCAGSVLGLGDLSLNKRDSLPDLKHKVFASLTVTGLYWVWTSLVFIIFVGWINGRCLLSTFLVSYLFLLFLLLLVLLLCPLPALPHCHPCTLYFSAITSVSIISKTIFLVCVKYNFVFPPAGWRPPNWFVSSETKHVQNPALIFPSQMFFSS